MSMSKWLLGFVLLFTAAVSYAAKVRVTWVNPTLNTDGSALTDLSHIIIEWGTCSSTGFGERQAAIQVPAPATSAWIYPTGLQRVCVRAFAVNQAGVSSGPSNTAYKDLLPAPGKPVTLGQPVVLPNPE